MLLQTPDADLDSDDVFTYQFWPDKIARGAPYALLDVILDNARRIVVYNGLFDLKVLAHNRKSVFDLWNAKLFDPYKLIRMEGLGNWRLQALLEANELQSKAGSGLDAVSWWNKGDVCSLDLLAQYNAQDVQLLAQLCQLPQIMLPSGKRTKIGTFASLRRFPQFPTGAPQCLVQNSAEWFAYRKGKIGASSVASFLDLDYFTPRAVSFERLIGNGTEMPESEAMRRGHEQEPVIARQFASIMGVHLAETGSWPHPSRPYLFASPDRLVVMQNGDFGLLEIKSVSRLQMKISDKFLLQVQIQLACAPAARFCYLAQSDGKKMRIHRINPDLDLMKLLAKPLHRLALV